MKKYNILAVGEVLYDVIRNTYKLGGAPFNVAAHMAKLGNESYILSSIGTDELGDKIIDEAEALNVDTDFIHRDIRKPTGTVEVKFEDGEPDYEIVEDVAWDYLQVDFEKLNAIDWTVVAFGSLAQRTPNNQSFYYDLFENLKSKWIYFDCNLRREFYTKSTIESSLKYANIAKFNEHEIEVISELLYGEKLKGELFGQLLQNDYNIEIAVYTWGKEGSKAWYKNKLHSVPGIEVKTHDTVGAGDAFSAGFLHSWIHGKDVKEALKQGNRLGGYVASHSGAIPEYDDQLMSYYNLQE